MPWGDLEVPFLGGVLECPRCRWARPPNDHRQACPACRAPLREWKTGPAARALAHGAIDLGVPVHMSRVNTARRVDYARALGCASVDGTTLAVSAGNLTALLRWLQDSETAARDGSLLDVFAPIA